MRGQAYVISAIVVVILISIFAIINIEPVEVNYIFWKGYSPLILVILGSVLMGGLVTAFSGTVKYRKLLKKYQALKKDEKIKKQQPKQNVSKKK